MDTAEFVALQYSLVYTFGPAIGWWFAFLVAIGVFTGVLIVWLAMLRRMTRPGTP